MRDLLITVDRNWTEASNYGTLKVEMWGVLSVVFLMGVLQIGFGALLISWSMTQQAGTSEAIKADPDRRREQGLGALVIGSGAITLLLALWLALGFSGHN